MQQSYFVAFAVNAMNLAIIYCVLGYLYVNSCFPGKCGLAGSPPNFLSYLL